MFATVLPSELPTIAEEPQRLAAHVLATAVELNEKAACRAVVVTAINEQAQIWWERFGFRPFAPDEPDQLDLYLLTSEIEATLRKIR